MIPTAQSVIKATAVVDGSRILLGQLCNDKGSLAMAVRMPLAFFAMIILSQDLAGGVDRSTTLFYDWKGPHCYAKLYFRKIPDHNYELFFLLLLLHNYRRRRDSLNTQQ